MPPFRQQVDIDYSPAIRSSRQFVADARAQLNAFVQAATAAARGPAGTVRNVSESLAQIQGGRTAQLGASRAAGVLGERSFEASMRELPRLIETARRTIERSAERTVSSPNPVSVERYRSGIGSRLEQARQRAVTATEAAARAEAETAAAARRQAAARRIAAVGIEGRDHEETRAHVRAQAQAALAAARRRDQLLREGRLTTELSPEAAGLAERERLRNAAAERNRARIAGVDPRVALRAEERTRAEAQERTAERARQRVIEIAARRNAAEALRTQRIEAATQRELLGSQAYIRAQADSALAHKRLQQAINRQATEQARASLTDAERGTRFQRVQAAIAQRQGGPPRFPDEFQNAGQFLRSRALTTAGFALSGAVLYGAASQVREMVREASALQTELAIVEGQFDTIGRLVEGFDSATGFQRFREDALALARDTATAADQVVLIERQLAGAFADEDTGAPDFARAAREGRAALQLSRVTGLPQQEITDSLTAVALAFGQSFEEIGDTIVGLETSFGVLGPELIRFTADLAPLGAELGFTAEQLTGLGAAAQQASGKSGAVLAEQLGRILPTLQENRLRLAEILRENPLTAGQATPLLEQFGAGDVPAVLGTLISAYDDLTKSQQVNLATLVGGRREASTFFALLDRGAVTLRGLSIEQGDFAGGLDERFERVSATVQFAIDSIERAVEELGIALFESGIGDGLVTVADAGARLVDVVAEMLGVFRELNEGLGGIPAKLLAVALAIKVITAAGRGLGFLGGVVGLSGGALRGPTGSLNPFALGGLLSPYSFPAGAPGSPGGFIPVPQARPVPLGLQSVGRQGRFPRVGSAVAGIGAGLGGLVAPLAIVQLLATVDEVSAQVEESRRQLVETVQAKVAEGLSSQEIRRRIEDETGPIGHPRALGGVVDIGAGGDAAGFSNVEKLGLTLIGRDTQNPIEVAVDEAQASEAERITRQLRALLEADFGGKVHIDVKGRDPFEALSEDFIAEFERDPTNNRLRNTADRFIDRASGRSRFETVLADAVAELDGQAEELATATALPERQAGVAEATALFEAGEAPLSVLISALRGEAEAAGAAVRIAEENGDVDLASLQALQAANSQIRERIGAEVTQQNDALRQLSELTRGDDPASNVDFARQALAQVLSTPGLSSEARIQAAVALVEAQRALFEQQIENAESAAEALAVANAGFAIDDAARGGLLEAQLIVGPNAETIANFAELTNQSIPAVRQAVIDGIITYGQTAEQILQNLLLARRDELAAALANLHAPVGELNQAAAQMVADMGEINAQISGTSKQALKASTLTLTVPPATGTADTETLVDQQRQAEEDALAQARATAEARLAVQRAQAAGDPVRTAQIAYEAARVSAQYAETEADSLNALAAQIDAQNQLIDASNAIAQARLGYLQALAAEDPVQAAEIGVQQAAQAVAAARGEAAQLNALAQQVQADRALRDAIRDVYTAQAELAIAVAEAAGETVEVAQRQLELARTRLEQATSDGAGAAELDRLRADVIQAEANLRDQNLSDAQGDIDFALQMEKITIAQAIGQLEALLQIPNLTQEQTRDLLLRIKQLRDELGRDFQFDLGDIVPTVYEVRRFAAAETAGIGYQDNRAISITQVNNNAQDYQAAIDEIALVLSGGDVYGDRPRSY